jgi:hypothetical protein
MKGLLSKLVLPILSVGLLCFAIRHVCTAGLQRPETQPAVTPPVSPFLEDTSLFARGRTRSGHSP